MWGVERCVKGAYLKIFPTIKKGMTGMTGMTNIDAARVFCVTPPSGRYDRYVTHPRRAGANKMKDIYNYRLPGGRQAPSRKQSLGRSQAPRGVEPRRQVRRDRPPWWERKLIG